MKISRIEKARNEDVYNMEVESVHCFAVTNSNIIVHNCMDAMRYGCMYLQRKDDISKAAITVGI